MRVAAACIALWGCGFAPGGTRTGESASDGAVAGDAPARDAPVPDAPGAVDGAAAATTVFGVDGDVLAVFELNGDMKDTSGNGRDATLIGGQFVATSWGMGLSLAGTTTQGFDWSAYAGLLAAPYTVEIVVTPQSVACWKKLFGPTDTQDTGWYYCKQFQSYPSSLIGPQLVAGQRHYFAIVSTSSTAITVYLDGTSIGSTAAGFTAPPQSAIFFRDDTATQRSEELAGVVEAVRLSKVARSAAEIDAVAMRLATQP